MHPPCALATCRPYPTASGPPLPTLPNSPPQPQPSFSPSPLLPLTCSAEEVSRRAHANYERISKSFVSDLFSGHTRSTLICSGVCALPSVPPLPYPPSHPTLSNSVRPLVAHCLLTTVCQYQSTTVDAMFDLSLPIPSSSTSSFVVRVLFPRSASIFTTAPVINVRIVLSSKTA